MSFSATAVRTATKTLIVVGSLTGLMIGAAADASSGSSGVNPDDTIDVSEPPVAELPVDVVFDTAVGEREVRVIRLSNGGASDIDVVGIAVDGDGFELGENSCGSLSIGPGGSCGIEVVFAPDRLDEFKGTLMVEVGGGTVESTLLIGRPQSVPTTTTVAPPPPPTVTAPPLPTVVSPPTSGPPPTDGPPLTASPDTTLATDTTVEQLPTSTIGPVVEPLPGPSSEDVADCERRARDARVIYVPNLEMVVGVESEVEVTVTIGGVAVSLPTSTAAAPPTTVESAVLSCIIELRLTGTNFTIEDPIKSGSFLDQPVHRWAWDVTPEAEGQHDLDLSIVPTVRFDDRSEAATPIPFEADITVNAAPRSLWQNITDAGADVSDNPLFQIAVAAGLVGAGGAALRRRAGRLRRRAVARDRPGDHRSDPDDRGYL